LPLAGLGNIVNGACYTSRRGKRDLFNGKRDLLQ